MWSNITPIVIVTGWFGKGGPDQTEKKSVVTSMVDVNCWGSNISGWVVYSMCQGLSS